MSERREDESTAAELFDCYIQDLASAGHDAQLVVIDEPPADLVDLAAKLNCDQSQLHKTVCLNYKDGSGRHLVTVIVPAAGRVDMSKVKVSLGISVKVKAAQADFITAQTGFVPGGIPPIGFESIRLVDSSTLQHQTIYAGGGNNPKSYTRMAPTLFLKLYPNTLTGDFLQNN